MSYQSIQEKCLAAHLLAKHFGRKHGPGAYYGQPAAHAGTSAIFSPASRSLLQFS